MPTIQLKTPEEIAKMRVAGRLAAEVLEMIAPNVVPGITTNTLNDLCHAYIVDVLQAIPAPLDYHGFPKCICASVNNQVCNGIPDDRILKNGDILNIHISIKKDGYHGATSITFCVGNVAPPAQRLVRVIRECLFRAIDCIRPGATIGDIGAAIQKHAKQHRYQVVQDFYGHGIGTLLHEGPEVPHYGTAGSGTPLMPGMTLAIKPMINVGSAEVKLSSDGWTVITKDRSLSAQCEHTVLVTDTGYEVLTLRKDETAF